MSNTTKISKQIEKINKLIEQNNLAFKKASAAEKRVLIAQDVLTQLKASRYVAESGVFVEYTFNRKLDRDLSDNESVQQLFAHKEIDKCNVCALGGMFMSCTNLNNNTTLGQLDCEGSNLGDVIEDEERISNGLDKFFTTNQLVLIEIYFERGEGYFIEGCNAVNSRFYKSIDFDHVNAFYDKYEDDAKRLGAIMQNIIDNKGTFVPKTLKV